MTIVIPAHNEERSIAPLLTRLLDVELPCKREIIVVDDGSTDGTVRELEPYLKRGEVRLLRHENGCKGKGTALRTGFAAATGDFIIVQDADEEYDPRDIPALIEPLLDGRAQVVYGSRTINEHCRVDRRWTNPYWYGGRSLTVITNILFPGCAVTDEPVGYKAIRTDLLRTIPMRCTGFEFCPELTAKVLRRKIPIYNVPIRYFPRSIAEGKKIRAWHWFEAVGVLLKYRFVSDHGPIADFDQQEAEK